MIMAIARTIDGNANVISAIRMITSSDIKVSCLVRESEYYSCLAAIGKEFDLFERV